MIQLCNSADPLMSEDNSVHSGSVSALRWSTDGTRLVSGDKVRACVFACKLEDCNNMYDCVT